jgi:hypothetical protein
MTGHPGRCDRAAAAAKTKEGEMGLTMVRQKVKDGNVEEAVAAARDLFATLDRVRPEGLRYASTRVLDGSTFVILTELADGIEDPRPAIPEFLRFLEQLKGWVDGPPVIEQLDVAGSYNLFGPSARNPPFDR